MRSKPVSPSAAASTSRLSPTRRSRDGCREPGAGAGRRRRGRALPPDRVGFAAADDGGARRSARRARDVRTPASSAFSRRKESCRRAWPSSASIERRRIRYAHMIGVTPRIMREGMRADYRQVDRLSHAAVRADGSRARRSPSGPPAGTDFTRHLRSVARVGARRAGSSIRDTGRTCPRAKCSRRRGSVDGTFVCDGTAGDYFNGEIRHPRANAAGSGDSRAAGSCRRAATARISSGLLGLLPHRREQRSRRRARVRHQPRPARDDRHPAPGRESARRPPRVRRSLRQPDARRLEITHARRRAHAPCDVWIDDEQVIAAGSVSARSDSTWPQRLDAEPRHASPSRDVLPQLLLPVRPVVAAARPQSSR